VIVTTLPSRKVNRDVSHAKRAAEQGSVVITDRGKSAHVSLRHDDDRRLAGNRATLRDLLDHPGGADIEFDPSRFGTEIFRPADLS
jgi:hypothetical protein